MVSMAWAAIFLLAVHMSFAEDLSADLLEAERVVKLRVKQASEAQEKAEMELKLQRQVENLERLQEQRERANQVARQASPSSETGVTGEVSAARLAKALLEEENRELKEELDKTKGQALGSERARESASLAQQGATTQTGAENELPLVLWRAMAVLIMALLAMGCCGGIFKQRPESSKDRLLAAGARYGSMRPSSRPELPQASRQYRPSAGVVDEEEDEEVHFPRRLHQPQAMRC